MVYNSAILGGCNNMVTACNTFVLGSDITAKMCRGHRTYVNKLEITGCTASGIPSALVMADSTGQRWCLFVAGGSLAINPSYD